MKKLLLVILLVLSYIAILAQDTTIDKGAGNIYFSGEPGTTPQTSCCSEVAINVLAQEVWIWNRDSTAWQRQIQLTQGFSAPSGDPGDNPYLYLNRVDGKLYRWTGSAWSELGAGGGGGVTDGDKGDITVSGSGATWTIDNNAITTAKINGSAVDSTKIGNDAVLAAEIATGAVTSDEILDGTIATGDISDDAVTAAKIGTGEVGADALAATAVTAGSYTNADITVDADGRVTAASNGSGGGASAFTGLSDTPSSYSGQANKMLLVNSGGTALIFADTAGLGSGGGGSSNIDSLHLGTIADQTDTIIFFGNSITNNLAVVDADKRWPNIVAANHDAFAHNEGISGSRMQDSPASANAMINRIDEIPSKRSTHLAIVFLYGANDMQTGTGSDTQFQTDYQEVIDSCIARGWSSSEIIVLTPTPLTTGGGAPQSEQDDYNTATNALTNCTIVDVYTPLSLIGVDNFTSDGTHPEELGSSVIASYVSEAIDMTIKSKGQGVAINGTTELDTVLLRNLEYASDTLTEILMLEKDGTVKKRNKYDENWVYSHTNIDVANDISVNGFTIGRGNPTATTTAFFGTNKALTTASQSTIFGVDAGEALTTGNANTFFGWQAGSFTTTQVGSTFFGARAGERSTANSNSFFGYNAGLLVTTGASNNALGANALSKTTTGSFNIALGRAAVANTTGSNNIAIGEVSLFSAQTLSNITAIGVFALQNYTTGSNTAAIGHSALVALEEANDTYAMGASVGNNVKNTDRSVLLGTRAGSYANFDNVVAIGYESGNRNPTTNSSVTVLDASTDVDISNEQVTITGHGKSWSGWVHCKVVGADVPGGLISGSFYAVQVIDANTLEFDRNLTSTGSGTFTIADQVSIENSIAIGSNSDVDGEDQIALGDGSHTELRAGKFEWNIDQDTSGKDGYVMSFNSSSGQLELATSSSGSVTASDVSVTDSATKFDSTTVEGVLEELATPSYAQIAQTVTFNGNANDRIDTITIDDTWNILSRPENFAVIDTTSGDWNADSLAIGKLIYLGSKTKKLRLSVSFSGEMLNTGDASWVGIYKNSAIENHSVKKVWFENLSPRDYHLSYIVELATNDTLDIRFRDETSTSQTVYLYSCNISLNEL